MECLWPLRENIIVRKVLLIGPSCFGYNQSIASAFDPKQFEVKVIDYAEQFGAIRLGNKISYFISKDKRKISGSLHEHFNKTILKLYNQFHPEIVLIIKGDVIRMETISRMKGSKNVLWMLDGMSYCPKSLEISGLMDAVFLFEKSDETAVKKINRNSFYLPPAFDPEIFRQLPSVKKDIDLLFIGTLYPDRVHLLEKIKKKFPRLKIKIYCERYRFYKSPVQFLKSIFDNVFINRFVSPRKANLLYNRSRICLNMHREESKYGINPRFFEIIGAGGYQLVDHKPFIDDFFPEYYTNTYHSEEELFGKIEQFIKGKKDGQNDKVYQEISEKHTFRNRIEYIIEELGITN